jgi:hypothetical protein
MWSRKGVVMIVRRTTLGEGESMLWLRLAVTMEREQIESLSLLRCIETRSRTREARNLPR